MRKLLSLMLALLLLVTPLAACQTDDDAGTSETTVAPTGETTAAPAETKPIPTEPLPINTVINQIGDGAKRLNNSTKGKAIILSDRDSADDILRAFVEAGYVEQEITRVDGAKFSINLFMGAGNVAAVYFFPDQREVRVAWEDASAFDPAVLTPNDRTDTGVLQFAQVGVERVGETDNPLNGMIQIARLSDGRAIIVDGGNANAKNAENIYNTLGKLDIVKDTDGKFIIAAWLITHAHSDHIGGPTRFIELHGAKVTIESFIYHFCTDASLVGSNQQSIGTFLAAARTNYPDAKHLIPHAGVKYYIGNATLSMIYVPELIYRADRKLAYYNDTSLVFRLGVGDTAAFEMGDAGNAACEVIHANYDAGALKSDILQITHHGLYTEANSGHAWRFVREVYDAVASDLAILPMHAKLKSDTRNGRFTVMGQWCDGGNQISYVMNKKDKPFVGELTQLIWDLFEMRGTINNVEVDTLYGYDGVNVVTNERGMVTYLGGKYDAPMITMFEMDGKETRVTVNEALYAWLGVQ